MYDVRSFTISIYPQSNFAGTSLSNADQKSHDGSFHPLKVSQNEMVFMYKFIGTCTWFFCQVMRIKGFSRFVSLSHSAKKISAQGTAMRCHHTLVQKA